ncbi:MAG TPA: DUF4421 family protein [Bacteroidia bacterium]|nr:DUF4421 family protein [Bacteroidia bacterium]
MANQRQIKSAASWLVTSNIHHEKIKTAATIIPPPLASYYGGDAQLQTLQWWGINMGAGATGNLVILRKLFIHGTISFGAETQFREYVYNTGYNKKVTAMGFAGDFKAGIGFNSESFFISINNNIDYHSVSLSNLKLVESLVTGYLIIGYRFKVKDPPLYQKLRETRLYKSL